MKLRIKQEKERVVDVYLEMDDGIITLMADGWCIVSLLPNGTLLRCDSIDAGKGFQVNDKGHIKLLDE